MQLRAIGCGKVDDASRSYCDQSRPDDGGRPLCNLSFTRWEAEDEGEAAEWRRLACGAAGPVEDKCVGVQNVRAMEGSQPCDLSAVEELDGTGVDCDSGG
ncbi:hypothetical protein E2562_002124 [Oryza meyeriana var. granulata]|uniref:Uncharacterized protein n=1 Tax=Oryza meyeriana var. granulata TaxID=110450 RepID=A0A6G1ECN4_9ORYZ|nr:hypothetical protein E2562_002124 [Oryza meyeriana var. granulata]